MKELIIIGARGFAREIYNLAIECSEYNKEYTIKGFLDDNAIAMDDYIKYPPIISSVEDYEISSDDIFICALGDVKYKKKYVEIILAKGGVFTTLIHPSTRIGTNTQIGKGCIILGDCNITCDIIIGSFVTIQPYCAIGHDVQIDDFCHLNAFSFLGGYVKLEEEVTINTGSIVLPHKKVLKSATVGAGSVVVKNVKEESTVFGIPAINIK